MEFGYFWKLSGQVKKSRLINLTREYELFKMKPNESIQEIHTRFVNPRCKPGVNVGLKIVRSRRVMEARDEYKCVIKGVTSINKSKGIDEVKKRIMNFGFKIHNVGETNKRF